VTVNIWNINIGDRRPHVRVPYNDSVTTVRDYTPRRRIRGAETLYASGRSAADRVRSLESTSGRESFSRTARTGGDFARTDVARIDRGSRTRDVRIDQQAPDYARASRSNPVVASNTRFRGDRDDESVTVSNSRDRQGGPRTQAGAPRENESARTNVPARGGVEDNGRGEGRSDNTTERSRTARTDIDPGTTPARTRTQEPGRTAVPRDNAVTPGSRTRSAEPESFGNTRPSTPARTRTQEPGRTQVPEGGGVAPGSRTRSVAPESSGNSRGARSTAEPTRTPARTSVPEVNNAPGRTSAPRTSGPAVDRGTGTRSAAPATRERTESRGSYTPPSRTVAPERPAPSVRQNRVAEPTRSESRVQYTPDVERSVPQTRAPATVRGNVDARPMPQQAPQSSGRSYSAPAQNNNRAPSVQAPRVESSRGGNIQSAPRPSGGDSGGGRVFGGRDSGARESGGRGR
jgi:hypothetical protein